jgi:hypothetical protein
LALVSKFEEATDALEVFYIGVEALQRCLQLSLLELSKGLRRKLN